MPTIEEILAAIDRYMQELREAGFVRIGDNPPQNHVMPAPGTKIVTRIGDQERACLWRGERAIFHRWVEVRQIVPPSVMVGGHAGGVVSDIFALVEIEGGSMTYSEPKDVQFIDTKEHMEVLHGQQKQ